MDNLGRIIKYTEHMEDQEFIFEYDMVDSLRTIHPKRRAVSIKIWPSNILQRSHTIGYQKESLIS